MLSKEDFLGLIRSGAAIECDTLEHSDDALWFLLDNNFKLSGPTMRNLMNPCYTGPYRHIGVKSISYPGLHDDHIVRYANISYLEALGARIVRFEEISDIIYEDSYEPIDFSSALLTGA